MFEAFVKENPLIMDTFPVSPFLWCNLVYSNNGAHGIDYWASNIRKSRHPRGIAASSVAYKIYIDAFPWTMLQCRTKLLWKPSEIKKKVRKRNFD